MASWAALNVADDDAREKLAQERTTEEAQDANNAVLYDRALRFQHLQATAQARTLYLQLLSGRVSPHLAYLCNKNVATMDQAMQSFESALHYFAAALALDATDVVVWFQMATTAVETGQLWLARRSLEEGMKVDAAYWPLVETLAQVLHQIGDVEEYQRVAQYLRQNDPHCATLLAHDRQTKRARPLAACELKSLQRAKKKVQHLNEIADREVRKRKQLQQEMNDALNRRRQVRRYDLLEPSWTRLGTLLLEIFEATNKTDMMQTAVEIKVGFTDNKVEQPIGLESKETSGAVDTNAVGHVLNKDVVNTVASLAKRAKHNEIAAAPAVECALLTGLSDNDTQDSSNRFTNSVHSQPRRRKSRRHAKRLQEEQAAAVKKAREIDLANCLQAFLPEAINGSDREAGWIEWVPPLNINLVGTEFRISDANDVTLLKTPSFALASCIEAADRPSQTHVREQAVSTSTLRANDVTKEHISTFIDNVANGARCGIMDYMRHFIDQCGQWYHFKLERDGEEIYQVCLWLEKALNGELNVANATRPTSTYVITVADHSVGHGNPIQRQTISPSAQLFLLELHFDRLWRQPVRGKSEPKAERLVKRYLARAQKLLFEFGWLEDLTETINCPTDDELLRLLWLIAQMHERCGHSQLAQQHFMRCRDKHVELNKEKDKSDGALRIELPNLKSNTVITLALLDEKISGLQFSEVCHKARRLFDDGFHDRVIAMLLDHFFPFAQAPRMTDFLHEFNHVPRQEDDNSKRLIAMLLESIQQSSTFSNHDQVLFLLTTFYSVIDWLDGNTFTKDYSTANDSMDDLNFNALAAMEFLVKQLTYNHCEQVRSRDHWLLLRALCVRCLKPSILLRIHSTNEFFTRIRIVLEMPNCSEEDYCTEQRIGVEALSHLLYDIRSRSGEEGQGSSTLVPHSAKKKTPRRDRLRVVLVDLLRFLNRAFQRSSKLALSFSLPKRFALMTLCCTLMKEEEEALARSDAKTSKQLFGNGAILFILLFESFYRPDPTTSLPTRLVDLIHLLHKRLGQHGICSLAYLSDAGSEGDTRCRSCFLETCTALLARYYRPPKDHARNKLESLSQATKDKVDESGAPKDEHVRFQMEVSQCYRCLYDVQLLAGCEDHKAGTTFASLQSASLPVKHADALRLARFAVPILLTSQPKNNGQKKERLKLLYALRDALADSNVAALSALPAAVFPLVAAYLAPRGFLQQDVALPFPIKTSDSRLMSFDEICLSHLWYLLGANFILGRVKRRGNLSELTEIEQHVRERVEFLVRDVLYFHPDRIDSWIGLGKTMKELYHAATDAFAAVLGRQRRIRSLHWYTSKSVATAATRSVGGNTRGPSNPALRSSSNVMGGWDLFTRMKEWQAHNTDDGNASLWAEGIQDQEDSTPSTYSIEDFAMTYIMQVLEFAKRCFEMAAKLAEEAARQFKANVHDQRDELERGLNDHERNWDQVLNDLESTIIECNEECGMLVYNLLQEFSLMKDMDLALFPRDVYSRLVSMAMAYFQQSFSLCKHKQHAHETHFRLLYMIGKTLKKKRWCEQKLQGGRDPEAYATATDMAECFAKAEEARWKGDREHALVHAFYALQALRIDLTTSENPSTLALRLVYRHFYEKKNDKVTGADETSTKAATLLDSIPVKDRSGWTNSLRSRQRGDILALLSEAESNDSIRKVNVMLAQGWLALNIVTALESIPEEDRYFHPSRYVLARLVYWLSTYASTLEQSSDKSETRSALLEALKARQSTETIAGPSDAAARALKEMAPIFDKRRPQVVAIWFSEYIPTAKKFEELNQRQVKYDYYRLKYWRFYIALLEENAAYGRLKEVGSWVLACKEEHDVIDWMLAIVLEARGKALRSRLREVLDTAEPIDSPSTNVLVVPGSDRLLKLLAKTYTYYLEVLTTQQRLAHVENSCKLVMTAEVLVVAVFSINAVRYPSTMPLLAHDAEVMDQHFNGNVTVIMNSLFRDELPPCIYDAQNREAWKAYLAIAQSFCEEMWPERSGKDKQLKKHSRGKAAALENVASSAFDTPVNQLYEIDPSQMPQSLTK